MLKRHRLELRCPTGNPSQATIHLDGEQLMFVTRVELVFDAKTREATARLTVPAAYLDIDVDAAAFVAAHTDGDAVATSPEVGEAVHYLWAESDNPLCIPAKVGGIQTDGKRLNLDTLFGTPGPTFIDAVEEDPSAQTGGTWHWPCDKAKPAAAPEPDAPPTTVNIHVHGSVLSERDLRDVIEKHLLQLGMRNPTTYAPYKR